MTLLRLFFTAICCFLSFIFVYGQNDGAKKVNTSYADPFSNGKYSFTFRENIFYGAYKTKADGIEVNKSNRLSMDFGVNRWFKGGWAVGLRFNGDWSGDHPGDIDDLYRSWTVSPSLSYGKELSNDQLYGYIRVGGSIGKSKDIYKTPVSTDEDEADLSGFKATLGLPLRVVDNTFLTTQFHWEGETTNFSDGKEKDNGIGLRVYLEDYLRCSEFTCDRKTKYSLSRDAYDQGSMFIDYNSLLTASFGKTKLTYDITPGSFENKYNNLNFNGGFSYYFIDYLAVGGQLGFRNMLEKSEDNDFKYTWSSFSFAPNITANVPVDNCWRNVFLKAGVNFGSDTYKVDAFGNTSTDKYSQMGFNAGVGFNHFIEKHTAFSATVGYRSNTTKEKDTDDESKTSGIFVSGGLRFSF